MKKGANNKRKGDKAAACRFAALATALCWLTLAFGQSLFACALPPSPTAGANASALISPPVVAAVAAQNNLASHGSYCHCRTCAGGAKCCCRPQNVAPTTPRPQSVLTAVCDEDAPVRLASVAVLPRLLPPASAAGYVAPPVVTLSRNFFTPSNRRALGRTVSPDPFPPSSPFLLFA